MLKICLASALFKPANPSYLGFPGTNPNVKFVDNIDEADFTLYMCQSDGQAVIDDIQKLCSYPKTAIILTSSDHDYLKYCGANTLYFSPTRTNSRFCVPYVYDLKPEWEKAWEGERPITLSFRGSIRTYEPRAQIVDLFNLLKTMGNNNCVFEDFHIWSNDNKNVSFAQRRYADLLKHSKFVLCPRGNGGSSMRLQEAIIAGAIPILVNDELTPFGLTLDLPRADFGATLYSTVSQYLYLNQEIVAACRNKLMDYVSKRLAIDLNRGCVGTIGYSEHLFDMAREVLK